MYVPMETVGELPDAVSSIGSGKLAVILLSDEHADELDRLVPDIAATGVPFLGAVMPALVDGSRLRHKGAVVIGLPALSAPVRIPLGEGREAEMHAVIAGLPPMDQPLTVLTYLDCLSINIAPYLSDLFNRYGNNASYFGGGAGVKTLEAKPCLFDAEGAVNEHALLVLVAGNAGVGVRHGWRRTHGPFVVTRAERRSVIELDWENAADVYRKALADSVDDTSWANFFPEVSMRFPFCLHKDGGEDIVRDPVGVTDDGHLLFLSDVPENGVLHIVRGDDDELIAAAGEAVDTCAHETTGNEICLISDCYSRVLMMGDAFDREVSLVAERVKERWPGATPEGALVLGEVAGHGEYPLEFFNKTIVVGMFDG